MKNKKGLKLGQYVKITKTQQHVLDLITLEYLTPPKIAKQRGTSLNAVYKTIHILTKKGLFNPKTKKVEKKRCTPPKISSQKIQQIRLHGQEFNIKLIKRGVHYYEHLTKSNTISIDDNTIRLYSNSIEIYSGKSFFSDDVGKATSKSLDYWNRFFIRLESELDIIIVKSRYKNINLVKHHYAYTQNDLSKEMNEQDIKIRIYAKEDNKMWFEIDNSWNLNEAETTHKHTAKQDMQNVVQPFFNDLRDNPSKLPSLATKEIEELKSIVFEIGQGLNAVVKLLKPKEPTPTDKEEPFDIDYVG